MAKYEKEDEIGDIGIDIVSMKTRREFSWIFREQPKNDLGIDGHIEIVSDERNGTGRLIAVQVKTGKSYFKNEREDVYVFHGNNKHLRYWLLHSLPVIIILCDEATDTCYWVEVTRSNVIQTDSAWKIHIPKAQILDKKFKSKLISIAGMPQHSDIVELALFKFLSEKYHKSSEYGRLDVCPLMHEPHDFMYFTCMAEFEKTSEYVYIAHHYDIYQNFSISMLEKFISWRALNISTCGHHKNVPKLFVFVISDRKDNLHIPNEIIARARDAGGVEIFRLVYSYMNMVAPEDGRFYNLTELDDSNEEIFMY
ncbi:MULTISPECIES: DUF4365 domain-containing protein [Burkholderia]|uniref:DUF4365 domain-containing protein n=1 Tax=Burkholderia TaxID=32008 RepID=UPI000E647C71|nr:MULTISPECIES: DUF4365 domain-containing protein [Burkholderia]MCR5891121.1 hypothetical protein [Burkholderia sp. HAN2018]